MHHRQHGHRIGSHVADQKVLVDPLEIQSR
jgi:hypothetical protein